MAVQATELYSFPIYIHNIQLIVIYPKDIGAGLKPAPTSV